MQKIEKKSNLQSLVNHPVYNNLETELHTDPVSFQNAFGINKNVKIPIENVDLIQ